MQLLLYFYDYCADNYSVIFRFICAEGTFLRSFGSWGSGDGEFKGMEGVAVTPTGNILVCDRENHRVQVF
jgi:tripartite motif-containing protein 71